MVLSEHFAPLRAGSAPTKRPKNRIESRRLAKAEERIVKVATGPGQIELRPVNISPGRSVVLDALLFNFDVDDAAVKLEHQNFLTTSVVTEFRRNPASELFLQGCASQSGANAYNLALSKKRVDAVKSFLVGQGIPPGRIETTFTGEEISTSTSKEDPRDRAVKLLLESRSTATVRFREAGRLTGFEPSTDPRKLDSLIVPIGRDKGVRLDGAPSVGRLILQNPGLAVVSPVIGPFPSVIRVRGLAPGGTVLEAWNDIGTVLLAELELVIKPTLVKSLALHVVGDTANHGSRRSSSSIRSMVDESAALYRDQSNVEIAWDGSVRIVRVNIDLGAKVEAGFPPNLGAEWNTIAAEGDPAASLRGFFVHDFDFTDTAKDEFGGAGGIPARDFMMGDDTPGRFETKVLAHEMGHCLGLEHADQADQLMSNSRALPSGFRISREETEIINPGPRLPAPIPRVQQR